MREAVADPQRGRGCLSQRGRCDETARVPMGSQERLHFTQQVRIVSGDFLEERRSLLWRHRECRVIQLTDLSVPLRRHR